MEAAGSALRKALCPAEAPDTYSHVLLSLATTDAAKTSRAAVGSISAIVLSRARKPADLTKLWGFLANQQGHAPPTPAVRPVGASSTGSPCSPGLTSPAVLPSVPRPGQPLHSSLQSGPASPELCGGRFRVCPHLKLSPKALPLVQLGSSALPRRQAEGEAVHSGLTAAWRGSVPLSQECAASTLQKPFGLSPVQGRQAASSAPPSIPRACAIGWWGNGPPFPTCRGQESPSHFCPSF